jgi:quercetin dioxygenase-like cupin family protein
MQDLRISKAYFETKEEAIREILDAGWWPLSWRDAPGAVFEPHKHDADQTLYLVEGEQQWTVDGAVHHLGPGDKLELPALTVHEVSSPKGAVYIIGMPKVDLFEEHFLAPDA